MGPVMLPVFDSSNAIHPLPAVCRASSGSTKTHELGARQEDGTFEVWICTKCGLTDWYAVDVNTALTVLSRTHGSGVQLVDGESQTPYR
jgi:hypothetical protein